MGLPGCDVEPVLLSRGLVKEANPILRVLELMDPSHGLGRELGRLFPLGLSLRGAVRRGRVAAVAAARAHMVVGINSSRVLL